MNIIIIATKDEAKQVKKMPNSKVIITGMGEFNVIKTISKLLLNKKITNKDKIFNIGYCGSNISPVGTVHQVAVSASEIRSNFVEYKEIKLCKNGVKCYSSNNFVTETKNKGIFDMELYTIANIFPKVKAIKIVSDSLSMKEYHAVSVEDAWIEANKILAKLCK